MGCIFRSQNLLFLVGSLFVLGKAHSFKCKACLPEFILCGHDSFRLCVISIRIKIAAVFQRLLIPTEQRNRVAYSFLCKLKWQNSRPSFKDIFGPSHPSEERSKHEHYPLIARTQKRPMISEKRRHVHHLCLSLCR